MAILKERKAEIVKTYGGDEKNSGNTQVQIALMTEQINSLTDHFKNNPLDFHSRRGLLKIVGKRKRLLEYLKHKDLDAYRDLISKLGLRR